MVDRRASFPPSVQPTLPLPTPEKRLAPRSKVLFGIGLAMVLALAISAWRSTQHFLATAERVDHSREILETEEKVLRHLTEMESARRGFLLTGEDAQLRGFDDAQALVNENYDHLRELIAEAAASIAFGASSEDLARTCHAHPTLPEAVKEAALAVSGRAIHF